MSTSSEPAPGLCGDYEQRLADDITQVFALALRERFPIAAAVPISQYGFDDPDSMEANNSSAFCFRAKTGGGGFSRHAYGLALDINPRQNPYWSASRDLWLPANATPYDPARPGTLTADSPIVRAFKALGWTWGGDWTDPKDWQHFEKVP